MFDFEFKSKAAKEVDKLPASARRRLLGKLAFYASQENPLRFATKLQCFEVGLQNIVEACLAVVESINNTRGMDFRIIRLIV